MEKLFTAFIGFIALVCACSLDSPYTGKLLAIIAFCVAWLMIYAVRHGWIYTEE